MPITIPLVPSAENRFLSLKVISSSYGSCGSYSDCGTHGSYGSHASERLPASKYFPVPVVSIVPADPMVRTVQELKASMMHMELMAPTPHIAQETLPSLKRIFSFCGS